MTTKLVVDLSNKTAQVQVGDRTEWFWSSVTRRSAEAMAHAAGWRRTGDWQLTSPPDGFWCPVQPCTQKDGAA